MPPQAYCTVSALQPVLANVLSESCRLLDIFVYKACGFDPLQLPCRDKVLRKLRLYYDEASPTERRIILAAFPELTRFSTMAGRPTALLRATDTADTTCYPDILFTKLSSAPMWCRQNTYYATNQMAAWAHVVPFEISSNTFIAHKYCDIIEATMMRHSGSSFDVPKTSVCVLEIGAGHGILSYLMARELQRREDAANVSHQVICSDFHSGTFLQLLRLPWVYDLCARGCLDFAVLKAQPSLMDQTAVQLLYSKQDLRLLKFDVLIVVANYAFDSFPVDIIIKNKKDQTHFAVGVSAEPTLDRPRKRKRTDTVSSSIICGSNESTLHDNVNLESKGENRYNRDEKCNSRKPSTRYCCSPYVSTSESAVADVILASDKFIPGAYVVPVAGFALLKAIRKLLSPLAESTMIVGDYFVCPDSKTWQLQNFQQYAEFLSSGISSSTEPAMCGWFDPPMISPSPDVCAYPVTLDALSVAFNLAFSSAELRTDEERRHWVDRVLVPHDGSSLYPSSFSVAIISYEHNRECGGDHNKLPRQSFKSHLKFGPNELAHIRQLLKEDKMVRSSLNCSQWKALFDLSCCDICLFLDHMWDIRLSLIKNTSCRQTELSEWIDAVVKCFFEKSYFTSFAEFCVFREKITSWLLSLRCPKGYSSAKAMFDSSSYMYKAPVLTSAFRSTLFAVETVPEVILCYLSAKGQGSNIKMCELFEALETNISNRMSTVSDLAYKEPGELFSIDVLLESKCKHWLVSNSSRRRSISHAARKAKNIMLPMLSKLKSKSP